MGCGRAVLAMRPITYSGPLAGLGSDSSLRLPTSPVFLELCRHLPIMLSAVASLGAPPFLALRSVFPAAYRGMWSICGLEASTSFLTGGPFKVLLICWYISQLSNAVTKFP